MSKVIAGLTGVRRMAADFWGARTAADSWRFSVRSKLLTMLLLTSLLSLGAITFLAYRSGQEALTSAAVQQLTSLRAAKKQQVEDYITNLRKGFGVIASAPTVVEALTAFADGFAQLGREPLAPGRRAAFDPAPDGYSFITRVRRYSGPDWTGLQTLRA